MDIVTRKQFTRFADFNFSNYIMKEHAVKASAVFVIHETRAHFFPSPSITLLFSFISFEIHPSYTFTFPTFVSIYIHPFSKTRSPARSVCRSKSMTDVSTMRTISFAERYLSKRGSHERTVSAL